MKFAADLYSYKNIVVLLGFGSRVVVITLVMYLTLAKVPKSFFKTFTLNLLAINIIYTVMLAAKSVRRIEKLYTSVENTFWFLFLIFYYKYGRLETILD
ncbi:unnamed protein product [Gongylonema pulchrum]|uniref:Flippase n=1 Tax=Gongylonema pulchrum TaxID=637853 RepID=A0A183DL94_9BILA|nr:unnamed protein product [Gongylonema pulchrum]